MDKALMSFLVGLATDPRAFAAYSEDRQAYVEGTALSPEAKRAVLDGDQRAIAVLAGGGQSLHTKVAKPTYYKKRKKKVAKKKAAKKKAAKKK